MEHTPGPWGMNIGLYGYYAIWAGERIICQMNPNFPAEANARLISAAPDLLDALKVMLHGEEIGEYECQRTGFPRLITRREKARAAIANAEGGGP